MGDALRTLIVAPVGLGLWDLRSAKPGAVTAAYTGDDKLECTAPRTSTFDLTDLLPVSAGYLGVTGWSR